MRAAAAIVLTAMIAVLAYLLYPAQTELPAAPTEDIYVADFARMVQDEDKAKLLKIGEDMDDRFGAQLVAVTIDSLDGEDIESYANRLFRAWGIGDAGKNNGVLLLIAKEDRKFRIEVGYGLEGAITDGYAGEVLDGMTPKFRDGDYSTGIRQAYEKLAGKIYAEYGAAPPESLLPTEKENVASGDEEWTWEDALYGAIFVIFVLVFSAAAYFLGSTVIGLLVTIALAILWYIGNVLLYLVTLGRCGSLSFTKVYDDVSSSTGNGNSSGSSGSSRGYGGGSSGGGGASGGW